jgi:hypothetical protein
MVERLDIYKHQSIYRTLSIMSKRYTRLYQLKYIIDLENK